MYTRNQIHRLFAATFFLSLAFYTWRSVLDDFLVENFGVASLDRGLMEAVREVPGLLSVLLMVAGGMIAAMALTFPL